MQLHIWCVKTYSNHLLRTKANPMQCNLRALWHHTASSQRVWDYDNQRNKLYPQVCKWGCKGYFQSELCGTTFSKKSVSCYVSTEQTPCLASLLYIRKQGDLGTLIIPVGDHASPSKLSRNKVWERTHSYNDLLSLTSLTEEMLGTLDNISYLEKIDGDTVYAIDGRQLKK